MIRLSNIFWLGVIAAAAFGLYMVKYQVKDIQEELAETQQKVIEERQALKVAKAEWAYLSRPERLSQLAQKHLTLAPMRGEQMADLEQMPMPGEEATIPASAPGAPPPTLRVTPILLQEGGDDQ